MHCASVFFYDFHYYYIQKAHILAKFFFSISRFGNVYIYIYIIRKLKKKGCGTLFMSNCTMKCCTQPLAGELI